MLRNICPSQLRAAPGTLGGMTAQHPGLHVLHDGPDSAPTMVLIHGTAASSRTWDALVPHLSTSHHVVRVDLPGSGQSPQPVAASSALADHAARPTETTD